MNRVLKPNWTGIVIGEPLAKAAGVEVPYVLLLKVKYALVDVVEPLIFR